MSATKARKRTAVASASNGNGQPKVFDLSSRYMQETLDVPIVDPVDGKPTGMVWTIGHQFSEEARKASRSAAKLHITAKGEVELDSVADLGDSFLEQIVAVTKSWNFVVSGEPLPCTPENARALLTDPRTAWIRPQVQAAYLSLSRFFGSAKPS